MATTGAKSSITTTAVQITSTSTPLTYGVWVRAAEGNSGNVFVGFSSAVTHNADATDGYLLDAGQEVFIPRTAADNATDVWVIGSASGQKVYFLAL